MNRSKKIGQLGERIAERYLIGKGYQLICRNWLCRYGEIDLVMKDVDQMVFVEVKARSGNSFGKIEDSINFWKRKRFLLAIQSFLTFRDVTDFRVDVVWVALDKSKKTASIKHLKEVTLQ